MFPPDCRRAKTGGWPETGHPPEKSLVFLQQAQEFIDVAADGFQTALPDAPVGQVDPRDRGGILGAHNARRVQQRLILRHERSALLAVPGIQAAGKQAAEGASGTDATAFAALCHNTVSQ